LSAGNKVARSAPRPAALGCIALTTDFGAADWFVGTVKGVLARLAPDARVIDLVHDVPPGDIRAGAFALLSACRYFPRGTVHLAVVDPGVGGPRRAIAVRTPDYFFVGPDNGVLSWALRREPAGTVHAIENDALFLQPLSRTFHGRDLFAPAAAHLARGGGIQELGPAVSDPFQLPWPEPIPQKNGLLGEVLYVDRYGNAITNLPAEAAGGSGPARLRVFLAGRPVCAIHESYQAVPAGRPVAVAGSSGFIEIAVNGGSAARRFGLKPGRKVLLRSPHRNGAAQSRGEK